MKIAIFIEEQSSKEPIKTFIHKILGQHAGIIDRVVKRGNLLNEEKVKAHINFLLIYHSISKIIVCVDSECTPEEEIEKITNKIEKSLKAKIKQPIYYITIVHAFEGWLLSDPDCIKKYLGPRAKVNISPSASKECKPKEVMKDIFRKADKDYIHTLHNTEIAERANPERIMKSNKSFKKFYDVIKDP